MSGHRGHFLDAVVERVYATGNVFFISERKDNGEKNRKMICRNWLFSFKLVTGKYVDLNDKNVNLRHTFGRFKTLMRS